MADPNPPPESNPPDNEPPSPNWWADPTLALQRLWDNNALGHVMAFLDWETAGYMIVPAILEDDLETLQQLSPEAVETFDEKIMEVVLDVKSVPVLRLLIGKKLGCSNFIDPAADAGWWEGTLMLYEAGIIAGEGGINVDEDVFYQVFRKAPWEMVGYGILNGMLLPQDFYIMYDQGIDPIDEEGFPPGIGAKLNEAMQHRIEEEYARNRAISEAYKALQSAYDARRNATNSSDRIAARRAYTEAARRMREVDPNYSSDDEE